MNSPSEKNTSDSLLQALLEKNTQDLAEIQLKPYTPTVYAIPDTIWTAMINLFAERRHLPAPTLYQKLQPLATWEEVAGAGSPAGGNPGTDSAESPVAGGPEQPAGPCPKSRRNWRRSKPAGRRSNNRLGREQERFTSKLSEEFSAWKNELEDFQQQTERQVAAASPEVYPGAAALLGLGLRGVVDAAAVIENEEEDEEQRRERILAEANGQDLGAALGIVLGLASRFVRGTRPPSRKRRRARTIPCSCKGGSVDQTRNQKVPAGIPGGPHRGGAVGDPAGVSTKTVYKLLKEGALPACKVGRENRVAKVELVNFLRERDKRGHEPPNVSKLITLEKRGGLPAGFGSNGFRLPETKNKERSEAAWQRNLTLPPACKARKGGSTP